MDDIITSILQQIVAIGVGGSATYFWQLYTSKTDKESALERAVQALLRDRILQVHHYSIERGSISVIALENAEKMFEQYSALHGNGMVINLMQDLRDLPIEN